MSTQHYDLPDARGHFGPYGGIFVAETLIPALDELKQAYADALRDPDFIAEFEYELKHYVGRPSPVYHAARLSREILAQAAFDPWRGAPIFPARNNLSDTELAGFVRAKAETIYHPAGTCRIGKPDEGVVDPQLRVHGIAGLRVVDASVMPTLPSGTTNAPTIMMAERAADLIKAG